MTPNQYVNKLRDRIDAYPAASVRALAAGMGSSYQRLAHDFTVAFGVDPIEYRTRARIRQAQKLLADTDWKVATVARTVGYTSHPTFSLTFARIVGCPPRVYRETARQATPAPTS